MKGFVFSLDAVFALMIVLVFSSFAIFSINSYPYSRLAGYEVKRYADTSVQTMKADGTLDTAISRALAGQQNLAENGLRNRLADVYDKKYSKYITVYVFNQAMTQVAKIESAHPKNALPEGQKTVTATSQTYVYGDYNAIITLQVWEG